MRINQIIETRQGAWQWLKKKLPKWPDYILRDLIYQSIRTSKNPSETIDEILKSEGIGPDTIWKLEPNFKFNLNVFNPWTVDKIKKRWNGKSHPDMGIPNDAARHATQKELIKKQGGIQKEPVIIIKKSDGYELIEGWHRTIQHFSNNPNGYIGPAWIAVSDKS